MASVRSNHSASTFFFPRVRNLRKSISSLANAKVPSAWMERLTLSRIPSSEVIFFIRTIRRYDELDHLTPYAARELIHAVRVGKAEKIDGKRHQEIRIEYDLVGFIPINELLKAVQAA